MRRGLIPRALTGSAGVQWVRTAPACRGPGGCRDRGRGRVVRESAVDVRHHVLDARVVLEPVHRQVLAVAAVLEAAVRHLGDERDVGVDPDAAEVQRAWPSAWPGRSPWSRRWRPGRTRTPLAQASASSSSVNRCTVMTGPKISSWIDLVVLAAARTPRWAARK